ncbi:MAG: magnesium transporter [Clostridia bacterium]
MENEILTLLSEKRYGELKKKLDELHEADIAELLEDMPDAEMKLRLFRMLPKDITAQVFSYISTDVQQELITLLTDTEQRFILDDMYMDDYADMMEELPANVVERVLRNSRLENRALINQYLKYPDHSAGSIMTSEYVNIKRSMTVREAFDHIRITGMNKETVYTCYVTDQAHKLEGVVTVRDMLFAQPDTPIPELITGHLLLVHTLDDIEDVAKAFSKYDMIAMPVVDNEERIVGIITIDDVVDVIQKVNTEDFERMAAISPSADEYLKTSPFKLAMRRLPWLMILMVSGMLTGALLEQYEATIAMVPLLVAFLPMLMDTGGNCGSQSATIVIRGMALDELVFGDFFRVVFKEARVALICGAGLAVVNFLRVWLQYGDMTIALVVSLTLMATVFISKSIGAMLPMLAKKVRLDPAIMASPLITTIVDCCSVFIYFNISLALMGGRF